MILARCYQREPAPQRFAIAGQRGGPGRAVRGQRAGRDCVVPEGAHPAAEGRRPAGIYVVVPVMRDEVDGPGDVTAGERMTDRLVRRSGLPVPGARPVMQAGQDVRLGPGQLAAQHLSEEMVVAVPLPGVIEWHDEEILSLQDFDDLRRVGRSDHRVAQRRAEPVEDGRPGQELPGLLRLTAEYLLGQEVDDEAVVAGELADEGARRGMTAQRERREIYPGRPSLGPFDEIVQVGLSEFDGRHGVHQRGGLSRREAQLAGPDLQHFPRSPQPRQRQRRVGPRDEHDLGGRREMEQQERQLVMAAWSLTRW